MTIRGFAGTVSSHVRVVYIIHEPLEALLVANKAAGKPCKYLQCDNAGENEAYVQKICAEHNPFLEGPAIRTES
jgi:hypothetical protein